MLDEFGARTRFVGGRPLSDRSDKIKQCLAVVAPVSDVGDERRCAIVIGKRIAIATRAAGFA
jgi:hypothetical protein